MTYYEGIDYFVNRIEFPNMASAGVSASNGDGTFTIFINALFCEEKQQEALRHELKHLIKNHFYRDDEIASIEHEANGIIQEFSVGIFQSLAAGMR